MTSSRKLARRLAVLGAVLALIAVGASPSVAAPSKGKGGGQSGQSGQSGGYGIQSFKGR
jgi:hypothetical protein